MKKKNTARIIVLTLTISLVLLATACASVKTTATSEGLQPVQLTWYLLQFGNPAPEQDKVYEAFNEKVKAAINATVEIIPIMYGEYEQKVSAAISSGEDFDLCFTSNWLIDFLSNASKGAFYPLEDLLQNYGKDLYATAPSYFWEGLKVNGHIYAVMNQQVSVLKKYVMAPVEVVQASGWDFDKDFVKNSYRSLEPLFAYEGADKLNLYLNAGSFVTIIGNFDNFMGGDVPVAMDMDKKEIVNPYTTEIIRQAAADIRYLNTKGCMQSKIRTSMTDQEAIQAGYHQITIGSRWMPGNDKIFSAMYNIPENIFVLEDAAILTTGNLWSTMTAINGRSKNPERAMMLLNLMNRGPQSGEDYNMIYNTLVFGIEGEHYTINADKKLEWIGDGKEKYYAPEAAATEWIAGSWFNAIPTINDDINVYKDQRALNNSAKPSSALGFVPDTTSITNEIANLKLVYSKYAQSLELGTATEADYDKFLAELDTAGVGKVITEVQKQFDAWNAAKK